MSIRFVVTRFCQFVHAFLKHIYLGASVSSSWYLSKKNLQTSVHAPTFAMFVVGQHFILVSHPTFCIAVRLCL